MSVRDQDHQKTVSSYLVSCAAAARQTAAMSRNDGPDPMSNAELAVQLQWHRELQRELANARVFHVPREIHDLMFEAYDRELGWFGEYSKAFYRWQLVTQQLPAAGSEVERERRFDRVFSETGMKAAMDSLPLRGQAAGYPQKLPFDSVFFGFGGGVPIEDLSLRFLCFPNSFEFEHVRLLGYLVTSNRIVGEFYCCYDGDSFDVLGDSGEVRWMISYWRPEEVLPDDDGRVLGWSGPNAGAYAPWVINGCVDMVNDFRKFIIEHPTGLDTRMRRQKVQKLYKLTPPVPKPYYSVTLQSELLNELALAIRRRAQKFTIQYSHRFDVRAHERARVRRDANPIDPKLHKTLLRYGYRIWASSEPDTEVYEKMVQRGMAPKREWEWLAVKLSWVKKHMKGPEGAPYVPAVRVVPADKVRVPELT